MIPCLLACLFAWLPSETTVVALVSKGFGCKSTADSLSVFLGTVMCRLPRQGHADVALTQIFAQAHRTLSSQDWSSQCPGKGGNWGNSTFLHSFCPCHPHLFNLFINFSKTFPQRNLGAFWAAAGVWVWCWLGAQSSCWDGEVCDTGGWKHLNFQADWTMKYQPTRKPLFFSLEWKLLWPLYFTISPFNQSAILAARKSRCSPVRTRENNSWCCWPRRNLKQGSPSPRFWH